jgi:predicted amidohydrolase
VGYCWGMYDERGLAADRGARAPQWERSERERILQAHALRTKMTTAAVLHGGLPPRSSASVLVIVIWSTAVAAIGAAAILVGLWIAAWLGAR